MLDWDWVVDLPPDDRRFPVYKRVHVLPYKDSFKLNFDHLFHNYLIPYFHAPPVQYVEENQQF